MKIEQEITLTAQRLLKACVDDYNAAVWGKIQNAVIEDVKESVGNIESEGFTDGDVALAIGRALVLKLN